MTVRRAIVPVLAFIVLATGCTKGSDDPSSPASGASTGPSSQFAVEVATSDLYVGAPQRVEVGLLSSTTEGACNW